MPRKTLFLACVAIVVLLATSAESKAWYAYRYHYNPYGGYRYTYRYGGGSPYGGYRYGYRYGYPYGGFNYGYHYGGYPYGGYRYGYYRAW
jgi:hypothetical protein